MIIRQQALTFIWSSSSFFIVASSTFVDLSLMHSFTLFVSTTDFSCKHLIKDKPYLLKSAQTQIFPVIIVSIDSLSKRVGLYSIYNMKLTRVQARAKENLNCTNDTADITYFFSGQLKLELRVHTSLMSFLPFLTTRFFQNTTVLYSRSLISCRLSSKGVHLCLHSSTRRWRRCGI